MKLLPLCLAAAAAATIAPSAAQAEPGSSTTGEPVKGEHHEESIDWLFVGFGLRGFALLEPLRDSPDNGMGMALDAGWPGPGFRPFARLDLGRAGDSTSRSPFDPFFLAGAGVGLNWTVWSRGRWALVAGLEYSYLKAAREVAEDRFDYYRSIHAPSMLWSLWRDLDPARATPIVGSLDIFVSEWVSGTGLSPSVGLGVTLFGGARLFPRP